jgi:RNA polymerase sigma-70 factor (ECF subfamily)
MTKKQFKNVTDGIIHASYAGMTTIEDKIIVKQVKEGDIPAFSLLIERYQDMAYTLAFSIVKNHEEAEEVAQDSFMKAFKNIHGFQEKASFSSWLYRIVYNTSISKQRGRKPATIDLDTKEVRAFEQQQAGESAIRMETSDRKKMLKQALNQLNDDESYLIILYYYKELSIDEIQKITGLSTSNIKVKLHRARKQMHDYLKLMLRDELQTMRY